MSLFRKPTLTPPCPVKVVNTTLTSMEWRQDDNLVAEARRILSAPTVAEMISVLALESPIKTAPLPPGATDIDLARAYGIEHGYQHAIAKLLSLAKPAAMSAEPEIEFKDL